ncbi:hypothetical protein BHYA_0417g00050 [Botrytis hyacinthi]|uniref:Uncharacterized protein n=1 Tax=Botrytis hyacinthi TaxID=278943 RepID=A0A4Z1G6Z1_9HELO|nr:hypothetical protein BHYA_0417g00050 [Botrytis hyacinthi]
MCETNKQNEKTLHRIVNDYPERYENAQLTQPYDKDTRHFPLELSTVHCPGLPGESDEFHQLKSGTCASVAQSISSDRRHPQRAQSSEARCVQQDATLNGLLEECSARCLIQSRHDAALGKYPKL